MDKVACIYRISHKLDYDNNNVYIGSTTNLHRRKIQHKSTCISENDKAYHYKLYEYIRENGGWENFQFIILRVCEDANKKELIKLEQSFIDVYEPTLNTKSASHTKDEWYKKNKERIKIQRADYRIENREEIIKKKKEYYEKNKEEILKKQKGYQQEHKEECNRRSREYREIHKEELNKKYARVIECECGKNTTVGHLSRHRKSKRHQEYLKFNEEK